MGFLRFYGHFAAAYGTLWLIMLFAALVSQSHLDAGLFGLFGFPLIALVYAIIRVVTDEANSAAPDPPRFSGETLPCEPFECPKCNHISRELTLDHRCVHCGHQRPAPDTPA